MKKLLFFFLLLMSSCSDIRLKRKHAGIDPEFKQYVDLFVEMSDGKFDKKKLNSFSMGFSDGFEKDSIVGMCYPMVYFTEIEISKRYWDSLYDVHDRIEIVFHELGHCLLGREHTKKSIPPSTPIHRVENILFDVGIFIEKPDLKDGCPNSIMNPHTTYSYCLQTHFSYYIRELFYKTSYEDFENLARPMMSASCKKDPFIINDTNEWNDKDQETLERSKGRCVELYNSCLKVFRKKDSSTYQVVCGVD